ncbi:MAG: hypothetical protein KDJ28_13540 [Candidatus Competibacteraceae bacterium]|nr:hypothetical protein [Candidatus Competibacteraceae bacterium]
MKDRISASGITWIGWSELDIHHPVDYKKMIKTEKLDSLNPLFGFPEQEAGFSLPGE